MLIKLMVLKMYLCSLNLSESKDIKTAKLSDKQRWLLSNDRTKEGKILKYSSSFINHLSSAARKPFNNLETTMIIREEVDIENKPQEEPIYEELYDIGVESVIQLNKECKINKETPEQGSSNKLSTVQQKYTIETNTPCKSILKQMTGFLSELPVVLKNHFILLYQRYIKKSRNNSYDQICDKNIKLIQVNDKTHLDLKNDLISNEEHNKDFHKTDVINPIHNNSEESSENPHLIKVDKNGYARMDVLGGIFNKNCSCNVCFDNRLRNEHKDLKSVDVKPPLPPRNRKQQSPEFLIEDKDMLSESETNLNLYESIDKDEDENEEDRSDLKNDSDKTESVDQMKENTKHESSINNKYGENS